MGGTISAAIPFDTGTGLTLFKVPIFHSWRVLFGNWAWTPLGRPNCRSSHGPLLKWTLSQTWAASCKIWKHPGPKWQHIDRNGGMLGTQMVCWYVELLQASDSRRRMLNWFGGLVSNYCLHITGLAIHLHQISYLVPHFVRIHSAAFDWFESVHICAVVWEQYDPLSTLLFV